MYGSRSKNTSVSDGPPKSIKPDVVRARRTTAFELISEDEREIELKTVNQMAVVESTPGLIFGTHTGANPRVTNNNQDDEKFNPFDVKPFKIGPRGLVLSPITVNVQGTLPPDFWQWVAQLGLDLHPDAKKSAAHTSGGHSALRTLVNVLIAGHWNEIIRMLLKGPGDRESIRIVCPGDKYAKTTSMLDSAMRFSPYIWYPTDDQMDDQAYNRQIGHRERFKRDEDWVRTESLRHDWSNHEKNQ